MSLEENKKITARFFEALRKGDLKAVDELTAESFKFHVGASRFIDKKTFIKLIADSGDAFPGHVNSIDDIVAEGEKVAVRMTVKGTHTGQWGKFAPTGKQFNIQEYFFLRIVNGKVTDDWGLKDALGHYQQLGILPPPDEIGK